MKLKQLTLSIIATLSLGAQAQDLSTEVVVDRTIEPLQRAASRLSGLTPALVLPSTEPISLPVERFTSLSPLTRSYSGLSPIGGAFAPEKTPWRGYASLGYFYKLNIDASAGYRFIDDSTRVLGADLQFNSEKYNPINTFRALHDMQQMAGRANVYYAWRADDKSFLTAEATYKHITQGSVYWENQNINAFEARAGWHSRIDRVNYALNLEGCFENNGNTLVYDYASYDSFYLLDDLNQIRGHLDASASLALNGFSAIGAELYGDIVNTGHTRQAEATEAWLNHASIGYFGLRPSYYLKYNGLSANIGLKVEMGINDDPKPHVAPDINLQWVATPQFGAWLRATGGEWLNTFDRMREITNYQLFNQGLRRSHIDYMIEAGLDFGPFTGFSAGVFGGYAKAGNWMMMQVGLPFFQAYDIKGYQAGIRLAYDWNWLHAEARGAIAPGKITDAWILNRDRAKYVIDFHAEARPIKPLTVGLDYQLRLDRNCFMGVVREFSLGDVNLLSVHAAYDINSRFSVFARGENLLSRRYLYLPYQASQKATGLVGLNVKF